MNLTPPPLSGPEGVPARTLVLAGIATFLADFLLWPARPGASIGYFCIALGACQIAARGRAGGTWRTALLAALLLAAGAQATVELSLSNVLVLLSLLLLLFGESHFPTLPSAWSKAVEACAALVWAPVRWMALGRTIAQSRLMNAPATQSRADSIARTFHAALPAAALGTIFTLLLSSGNAVLRKGLSAFLNRILESVANLDLSFGRLLFWLFWATIALALLWPAVRPVAAWAWERELPRWQRADVRLARWQGIAVLLVLNALFFAANTSDAVYLWLHARLPEGVGFSEYVHQGVHSLVAAVVLSGSVLAALFQQNSEAARPLRALAYVWIVQNLVLLAGVFLRLKLYVQAYQLTELRVYVGCFLLLVAVGLVLLAAHIARDGGLGRLLHANLAAAFTLFFALQFTDIAGWVARSNLGQWRREPRRTLDLDHLVALGPTAWPALEEVAAQSRSTALALDARHRMRELAARESARLARGDWRSAQSRHDRHARGLIAAAKRFPPEP